MSDDELAHSKRGPSGAHRWRRCKGSVNAEEGLADKVGREAAEGTVFHRIAAMCLEFGLDPEDFEPGTLYNVDGHEIEFDRDMQHYMQHGLDWIGEHVEPGDILIVEKRVDISRWAGTGQFGTCDVAIIKIVNREIIVFDWKYGKGIPVDPVKNDQCYLYGLGVWNDYAEALFEGYSEDIKVTFFIEQPRAPGGGGDWHTTMDELLAEGKQIYEDALETMNPLAARTPGEKQCQFCKASGRCPEQQAYLLDVFGQKFEDIEERGKLGLPPSFTPPEELSIEVRSFILLHWKTFKRYVDQIHAITLADLRAGRDVPLIKVVEGKKGHRYYTDPATVMAKLTALVGEDDVGKVIKTVPISPSEADKLFGKKVVKAELGAYIQQPPAKPILVHVDDKREAMQDYASKFDDLEDDEDSNGEE